MRYRLAWISRITGKYGHGEWEKDFATAQIGVKIANENFPDKSYWVEPGEDEGEEVNHDRSTSD